MSAKILLLLTLTFLPLRALADADVAPPPPSSVVPPSSAAASGEKLEPMTHKAVIVNEMSVWKLNGTIMVQHADKTDPTPLATGGVVEKGDVVTVYDGSWVILKSRRGDKIGLDGNTLMTLDECYFEGPDRQVRLLLQRGTLMLETNGDDSRQSFFEINSGKVVTSIDQVRAILSFDDKKDAVDIKYIEGKIHVIDQTHEETFRTQQSEYNGYTRSETSPTEDSGVPQEHTEHTWVAGKMAQEEPIPMEEIDELNFRKFFDGEPRVVPDDNNMLLDDSKRVPFRQR
jgi:hypothetical protein